MLLTYFTCVHRITKIWGTVKHVNTFDQKSTHNRDKMEVTVPKLLQKTAVSRIGLASSTSSTSATTTTTKIRQREDSGISIQKTKQKTSVVDDIVSKVDAEFRKRDEELVALSEAVREKEEELEYCEVETKKQIESTSILSSSISYRTHAAEKLEKSFDVFKNQAVVPLNDQFHFFCHKLTDCKLINCVLSVIIIFILLK